MIEVNFLISDLKSPDVQCSETLKFHVFFSGRNHKFQETHRIENEGFLEPSDL